MDGEFDGYDVTLLNGDQGRVVYVSRRRVLAHQLPPHSAKQELGKPHDTLMNYVAGELCRLIQLH